MRFRLSLAALPIAAFLVGPAAFAAAPKDDTCQGSDMLAETKVTNPEVYEQIMAEAAATENAGALLWKIERDGRPTSYLFGTVHLTDDRVTKLSPAVLSALKEAKAIALEVADLSENATATVIAQSAPLAIYSDGRRLDQMLTPSEYESVKNVVSRSGLPADLAALFKPWIVSMILSVSDCERTKVQQGKRVLDMKIAETGKSLGIPVVGLETIPDQLAALAAVPEKSQLDMLRVSLRFAHRMNDMATRILESKRDRRITAALPLQLAMARQAGVGEGAFAGFQQKLLTERNEKMISVAEPLLTQGGVFIAVGALHLPSKNGLVALLRQAGYTVTAVE
ncbi:MAG: TraB/GumN family protein [Hyphomicrobiaceae bacterium]|nr:TraB/GumN family protein [Hyphomicrobiaceae bacterium]